MTDRRKQFFFWLGVFVFPLFWSWFTLTKASTGRQRFVAFLWMAIFVTWLIHQWRAVGDGWQLVSITYPAILGWLTISLFVWLFFRIGFISVTIIEIIVLIDVLAVLHPSTLFVDRIGQPFDWQWLIPPVVVAFAHLAVEPLARRRISRVAIQPPHQS